MDASPAPSAAQPPDPESEPPPGHGPMPLTVCPPPDTARPIPARPASDENETPALSARPAFEDGTLAWVGPELTGPQGEGPSQVPGPQGHGSVLKRRTGWLGRRTGQKARRLATPLGILAAVAGAFAYVGTVDPNESGHYPVCPLLKLTGVLCPGCGGLRSAHAFVHGDLGAAFSANAIATAGYFLFAAVWVLWLVRAARGRPLRIGLAPVWWWGVGAVLLLFTVVRNLPFGSALAP